MLVLVRCYVERVSHMGTGITLDRIQELEAVGYGRSHSGDVDAIFRQVEKPSSIGMSIADAESIKADLGQSNSLGFRMWSAGWLFGVARELGLFDQCELAKVAAGRIAAGVTSHAVRSGLRDDWRSGVTLGIQAVRDDPEFRPAELGASLPSMQRGW
jgi:hypothetical protein